MYAVFIYIYHEQSELKTGYNANDVFRWTVLFDIFPYIRIQPAVNQCWTGQIDNLLAGEVFPRSGIYPQSCSIHYRSLCLFVTN